MRVNQFEEARGGLLEAAEELRDDAFPGAAMLPDAAAISRLGALFSALIRSPASLRKMHSGGGHFVQVLSLQGKPSPSIIVTKPQWTTGGV